LIVDDDAEIRNILIEFLAEKNLIIETASNGHEALSKAEKVHFDVVITDIKIPVIDGITLTRELLNLHPDISIMVMTGFSDEYSENDAISAGARDFISKPFKMNEFDTRFQKIIRDHKEVSTLKNLVHLDILTGLPNRKLFHDRLTQALEYAKRYNLTFALLYLDIDNFKDVNDARGHNAGDLLLKELGARLKDCVRKSDTVARLGGDEFTIILSPISGPSEAAHVAKRIVDSTSKPFIIEGFEVSVSSSTGISLYPSDGEDAGGLLKNADSAMYRVKERGKNGYEFFSPTLTR
jgi:diguanylate cyclase (GGDEF)-like protein